MHGNPPPVHRVFKFLDPPIGPIENAKNQTFHFFFVKMYSSKPKVNLCDILEGIDQYVSPTAIFQLLKESFFFAYKCLKQALRSVKWSLCPQMWINSYLNTMVVYVGFIGIHLYHNQNKIQIWDFLHFP